GDPAVGDAAGDPAVGDAAEGPAVGDAAGLFEVGGPDSVYDDAWAVNAVRVEPEGGSSESR
ncbi:hypothetical protein ACWDUL_40070, partial [Nocardia niigatensis]